MSHMEISPEDEQEKWLEEATSVVKHQAFLMKRALDGNVLRDALKHASNMICELRTSLLTPKNYYELYMQVFDQLRYIEHFLDDPKRTRKMIDLYELVQHAGNVLPRLYLLVSVGAVYIKSREAPAKDVLKDLVEMCKGVQHPMRGLFLRNYLSQLSKDKLPDVGTEYEGDGGGVVDAIEFIIQNFTEMNKLWVRMQHQGPVRDKEKREKERLDLRILVGTNLVRLSQLDGVDMEMYKTNVLPRVLEQIINCKDQIAQQYLMECVIQVFPDENHLQTLEQVLTTCTQLQAGVNVKSILVSLMDRLSNYAAQTQGDERIPDDIKAFTVFSVYVGKLMENQPDMPLNEALDLQTSLLSFCINSYPGRLDYCDHVFSFCVQLLESRASANENEVKKCERQLLKLLTIPVESYDNVLTVLELTSYPGVMTHLLYDTRKKVALSIVKNLMKKRTEISEPEKVEKLFGFIKPLVTEGPDGEEEDKEEVEEEQNMVARVVHLLTADSLDVLFKIYQSVGKAFGQGSASRLKYTFVPLVFSAIKLALRVKKMDDEGEPSGVKCKKVFQFIMELVTTLAGSFPDVAIRLFLQCAQGAIMCDFEPIAYEFVTQAFILYEDDIADSKQQLAIVNLIIGTLHHMSGFSDENYETLITKCAQYANKLLKKPDQSRAIATASHLFWTGADGDEDAYRDEKRVLECLKKALKIANEALALDVPLFVEILNHCLYYFEHQCETINAEYINKLVALVKERESELTEDAKAHFDNIIRHIEEKKGADDEDAEKFAALEI